LSVVSRASRLLSAAGREWGRMGPTDLWHMAEFDDPERDTSDPISYLSELLSTRITRFDLAEIMSDAINSIAGEEVSDVSGAKIAVLPDKTRYVIDMFTNDEGSAEADNLRKTIERFARKVAAENYRERQETADARESAPRQNAPEPQAPPETPGMVVVDRDPKLWAAHMGEDVDESVAAAFIQSGRVLVLDSGKPMLFGSEAEAEEKLGPLNLLDNPPTKTSPPETKIPPPEVRTPARPSTENPPAPPGILSELREKAAEAKRLTGELMSIQKSLKSETGFGGMMSDVMPAYTTLAGMSGRPGSPPAMREYDSERDDPAMSRLLSLLHDLLERQGELDEADVNIYPLMYLRESLYEFLMKHAKAASCDVLRRGPSRGMPKDGKNPGGPKGIALNVLKKEAIQLSKGNIRATKDGTITIDPGLMNCPVVREVMRQLETKASDMKSVRDRLDDLGMLVTQGEHGQVQVYCLVRSEGEGGARTKMCQWFIDAHGNDGKFKIECAKD